MTERHYNALPSGTMLFEFRIESVLGQGGFGLTYKAIDTQLNRAVAIKEYYPKEYCSRENDTSRVRASGNAEDFETFKWGLDRFLTEAKTLARFHNPSIVAIRRFFELNNTAYIVMDFVEGQPLDTLLKEKGTISWPQLEDFLRPLVEGLSEVHRANVLHRDIKPGNIYIKKDGKPILLDFGAASQEIVQHSKSVTSMASPGYGAFEQYSTHGRQGPYTDVYGLSATLYHVVTGKKPQDAPDRMLEDKVEKASVLAAGKYPVGLLQAIDSGLNVRPNDRPQTIEAWADFLGDFNKSNAKPTTKAAISFQDKKYPSTKKHMFTGIAIAILIPIAIFSWWVFSSAFDPNDVGSEPSISNVDLSEVGPVSLYRQDQTIPEEKILNVYNWSDYIAPETLDNFTKETGIIVTYDVFNSNEVLETKLVNGNSGYDVVVPSLTFLARLIQAGVFMPLDKSKIPNVANMDPEIQSVIAELDPDNAHSVNYLWGTTGIGYNVKKIKEIFGDTATTDSWAMVFEPANLAKLEECGVYFLDSPYDMIPQVLNYLGEEPNSFDPAVIAKAEERLKLLRPSITYFHSSQYISALAKGDACVAVGWSGDIFQAQARAAEAQSGVEIAYVIPKEGAPMWFDMLAIPKDAKHPNNAHIFINYLLRPEVAAEISNYVSYASANKAAYDKIYPDLKANTGVYPTPEAKKGMFSPALLSPEVDRLYNRIWTGLKTGQ